MNINPELGGAEQLDSRPHLEGTTQERLGEMPTRGTGGLINEMLSRIGKIPAEQRANFGKTARAAAEKTIQEDRNA
jgi:hypothetical protein